MIKKMPLQSRLMAAVLLTGFFAMVVLAADEEGGAAPDPMRPQSSPDDAEVSPLSALTLVTGDMAASRRFYQGGLDLNHTAVSLEGEAAQHLARHWNMAPRERIDIAVYAQPAAAGSSIVRIVEASPDLPSGRPQLSSRYLGPLGFGLPMLDIERRLTTVEALGFESTAGVSRMDFPRADQTTYTVTEIHFAAPDDTLVLGVDRGEMIQIGEIVEGLDIGGPAYSSILVDDLAETAAFLRQVLGLELRREMTFQATGPGGGMQDMQAGEEVAFQQWFSPGAESGYLVVMELLDGGKQNQPDIGMGSRGLSMYSFRTSDLAGRLQAWQSYSGDREPDLYVGRLPGLGHGAAFIARTPDGIPVEIFQLADDDNLPLRRQATRLKMGHDPGGESPGEQASGDDNDRPNQLGHGDADLTLISSPMVAAGKGECLERQPVIMVIAGETLDRERMAAYSKALADSGLYARVGGRYLNEPRPIEVLEGDPSDDHVILAVHFPSECAALKFWHSDIYQTEIKPLREDPPAGDYTVTLYKATAAAAACVSSSRADIGR